MRPDVELADHFWEIIANVPPAIAHAQRDPRDQLQSLDRELAELDTTLAPTHDDRAPIALVGLGGAAFAAGIVGTTIALTTAPCVSYGGGPTTPFASEYGYPLAATCLDHAEDWTLIGGLLALSGIGAALTITGAVWAVANVARTGGASASSVASNACASAWA